MSPKRYDRTFKNLISNKKVVMYCLDKNMSKFYTFKNLISKNSVYACSETKIDKTLTFEKFISLNTLPFPPFILISAPLMLKDLLII